MKALRVLLVTALTSCIGVAVHANPVVEYPVNELLFTANGWFIELHTHYANLDGWSLRSRSGTAYFKNGIQLGGSSYVIVTIDSLLTPLNISELGDSLVLLSAQGMAFPSLRFGNVTYPNIVSPRRGQSICMTESDPRFCYLDNSPTLGQPNDAANAYGTIQGMVTDSLGSPIQGIRVDSYSFPSYWSPIRSDNSGRFTVQYYGLRLHMNLTHPNFNTRYLTVQIWPESTISISVTMSLIVSVAEEKKNPSGYELYQSYPNPFNPKAEVGFRIAEGGLVTLKVYDVSGREIATLVNDVIAAGKHSAIWDASGIASGIYFYHLVAGNFMQTRKMVLAR